MIQTETIVSSAGSLPWLTAEQLVARQEGERRDFKASLRYN